MSLLYDPRGLPPVAIGSNMKAPDKLALSQVIKLI